MNNIYPNWPNWPANRTAIIAEVGINHGGDEALAWKMILAAHKAGADFVKLQSYVTKNLLCPKLPYYDSIRSMELTFSAQKRLFKKAKKHGICLITTAFDQESVNFAYRSGVVCYKVASMDNDNIRLIRQIAAKGKPLLISVGMSTLGEMNEIVHKVFKTGNRRIMLLYCVSKYPPKPKEMHLSAIKTLMERFKLPIGLSDHSIGLHSSYLAASMGVAAIEKHFTIDRRLHKIIPEGDNNISIEPEELKELRKFCESVPVLLGDKNRAFIFDSKESRALHRGVYADCDIPAGSKLTLRNTVLLRPAKGVSAGKWDRIFNRSLKHNIKYMEPIRYSDLE